MKNHKKILLVILITVLVCAGIFGCTKLSAKDPANQPNKSAGDNAINYSSATDDQKYAVDINNTKEGVAQNSGDKSTDDSDITSKEGVVVLITTWAARDGYMNVNGRVDGQIESDGMCTLKLTKGSIAKTVSRTAEPNATDTSCGKSSIPLSSLTPGTWSATLSYESSTSTGTSQPVDVKVPND